MRHVIAAALLLAACQPTPFETTAEKEDLDVTPPPGDTPPVAKKNDKSVMKSNVALHGPFASLEAVCGGGPEPRCKATAPVAVPGAGGALAVATFQAGHNETDLAVQTAKGWFFDRVPGEGPMWSHHSPHSVWFDFDRLAVVPDGFSVFVRSGSSSFIGGMGNRGSASQESIIERTCRASASGLVCEDSAPLYERSCQTPMEDGLPEVCRESGKKP
jgi:hypothetical protein